MSDQLSEKQNILFIITTLYGGGAEKVCTILASEMAGTCNVTLLYFSDRENNERYPIDPRCDVIKLPEESYSIRRHPIKWYKCIRNRINFCKKIKREKKINVSASLLFSANLLNVLSRTGERVIASERANPKLYQPEKFWITRLIYGRADHTVFQSRTVQSFYSHRVQQKSNIIMNPVSVPCLAAKQRNKRVVALGRLTGQKNHMMLIESFAKFHSQFSDYTLTIYGEGELRNILQGRINDLGLGDYIFLPGNLDNVHEHIRDAEIFVLSSNYEGLSNALLECMTMGIACISTRCEGSADVIRNGENGLLIDIGDQQALTDGLALLASEPGLRRKMEMQAMMDAKEFDKDKVIHDWEQVFFG